MRRSTYRIRKGACHGGPQRPYLDANARCVASRQRDGSADQCAQEPPQCRRRQGVYVGVHGIVEYARGGLPFSVAAVPREPPVVTLPNRCTLLPVDTHAPYFVCTSCTRDHRALPKCHPCGATQTQTQLFRAGQVAQDQGETVARHVRLNR